MNDDKLTNSLLEDVLKEVIFDRKNLNELKINIQKTISGNITPKEYRKYILVYMNLLYEHLHEKLSDLISYNSEHSSDQKLVNNDFKNLDENSLRDQLNEKNKFIETIAEKICKIDHQVNQVLSSDGSERQI
ncbi:MAG: hypothetical protein ACFFDH_05425 [Promethearchaeota archaeon]